MSLLKFTAEPQWFCFIFTFVVLLFHVSNVFCALNILVATRASASFFIQKWLRSRVCFRSLEVKSWIKLTLVWCYWSLSVMGWFLKWSTVCLSMLLKCHNIFLYMLFAERSPFWIVPSCVMIPLQPDLDTALMTSEWIISHWHVTNDCPGHPKGKWLMLQRLVKKGQDLISCKWITPGNGISDA